MIAPNSNVAISEADERVPEPRGAEELVVRGVKGGLWPALRRRAGEVLSRWLWQQAVLSLHGNPEDT
jgi:hypothetical protein